VSRLLFLRQLLEVVGGVRNGTDPRFEHLQAFGIPEAGRQRLEDVQIDSANPHAGFGPLLGVAADQRGAFAGDFVEVLADRGDFGQHGAVFQLQAGQLSRRVLGHVGRLAVLATAQVDLGLLQFDAAFGGEHAHDTGIGADGIV